MSLLAALALAAAPADPLAAIEARSGGQLAVVLIDQRGRIVRAYHPKRRMAFCSAFKLNLAAAYLEAAAADPRLARRVAGLRRDQLLNNSPVTAARLGSASSASIPLSVAAKAAVTHSDNSAANLVIAALGGPTAVTARWRSWGDTTSRLDRWELSLNENRRGDARDSSTPLALAEGFRQAVVGSRLRPGDRRQLLDWTAQARPGINRVRAGLPRGWAAGGKAGTCKGPGQPDQQFNDIGWFRTGDGALFFYGAMLARPAVRDQAEAALADVGRVLATSAR